MWRFEELLDAGTTHMTKINANLSSEVKNAQSSTATYPICLHTHREAILPFSFLHEIWGPKIQYSLALHVTCCSYVLEYTCLMMTICS